MAYMNQISSACGPQEPPGWSSHAIPSIEPSNQPAQMRRWTDISLYELHVRDFR